MTVDETVPTFSGGWGHASGLVDLWVAPVPADVQGLADRIAVEQVIRAWGWCIDEGRFDFLRTLLTEGVALTGSIASVALFDPLIGREVLVTWLEDFMAGRDDQLRHQIGNLVVSEQSATQITALAYLTLMSSTIEGTRILGTAFYRFSLVKQDGAWRIDAAYAGFDTAF